jgi:hypothetical protein
VAEPLLDLGNISLVRARVGRDGAGQRLDAEVVHYGADAGPQALFQDDVVADRNCENADG